MSEYNIQMNKYNALNAGYDQLYPATKIENVDGLNTALQNKADKDRVVNPNLLDNWYFGNPVDQRGGYVVPPGTPYYSDISMTNQVGTTTIYYKGNRLTDTYSEVVFSENAQYIVPTSSLVRGYTGYGYGIDRWYLFNNITCRITPDGLTLVSNGESSVFECYLDTNLTGITATMTALIGGVVYSGSKTVDQYDYIGAVSFPGGTIRVFYSGEKTVFRLWLSEVAGTTVQLKAAKLELGTTQTLAHQDADGNWVLNEIPNYGEQLARCQRYYQNSYCGVPVGSSDATGYEHEIAQSAWYVFHSRVVFPTTMRTTPTIKLYSANNGTVNNASEYNEGGIFVAERPVTPFGYNAKGFQWGSSDGSFTVNNNERLHWEAIADL